MRTRDAMIPWTKDGEIDLGDWGMFYPYPQEEFKEISDGDDKWLQIRGVWSQEVEGKREEDAILEVFTQLDGKEVEEYYFFFHVLDKNYNLLAGNI